MNDLIIPLAGHPKGVLICDSFKCSCGKIQDGIGFHFLDEAGWVISFTDLERLYQAARESRRLP